VTRYEYGPFDVLDAVTDRAGNRIQYQYDALGRLTNTTDPSSGPYVVKYNGYDEAVHTLNGAGESTTIDRDVLGRIWEQTHTDPVQNPVLSESFVWDTAANGLGKLAQATSTDGITTAFTYDTLGRLSSVQWDIGSGTRFATETTWDSFDRPQYFTYPAVKSKQLVLEYHYQPQGELYGVTNKDTHDVYWKLLKQDASGIPLSEQFGTSIVTSRTLDNQKRIKTIETAIPSKGMSASPAFIQQLSYDYGLGGLISSRHNVPDSDSSTEEFSYDFLGRLVLWTVDQKGTKSGQSYGYNDLGNLVNMTVDSGNGRTVTNSYGPSPNSPQAGPYAVRERDENGSASVYQYDTAGRQTTGAGRSITWNHFDLPSRIQSATQDVRFRYDAAHNRITKTGTGTETVYIGGAYERHTDNSGVRHVFNLIAPGRVLGQVTWANSDSTGFFHLDSLGTPETISDPSGTGAAEKVEYEPFGQRRSPHALASPASLPSTRTFGFTGHEADDEFGLINMGGRIYDPQTARFLTPDPVLNAPFFSQSLNRYSYAYNNPVNFVDPTGLQSEDIPWLSDFWYGEGSEGGWAGNSNGFGEVQIGFGGSSPPPPTYNRPVSPTQQAPTKADAVRTSADAGPGWGSSSSGGGVSRSLAQGWQWFKGQMASFAVENEGSWDRLKELLTPPLLDLGSLGPAETRRAPPPFPPNASLMEQMAYLPGPPDVIINAIKATVSVNPRTRGAIAVDWFMFAVGPAASDLTLGAAGTGGGGTTQVGRWMSHAEYDAMVESGQVQAPLNGAGATHVTVPPNPGAFTPPPQSDIFATFEVPTDQLRIHDVGSGWGRVFGPGSLEARLAAKQGLPVPTEMPPATNIQNATPQ
jgi:RHS repeat-associated protein